MIVAEAVAGVPAAAVPVPMDLLELLIIGALMGILGQGARAVIGLKGMSDDAKAQGLSPRDLFEAGRLLTSFLIGSLVGLASALVYIKTSGAVTPDVTTCLAWAVSAYAGTDAFEGFISQYLSPGATTAKKLQQQQAQLENYAATTDAVGTIIGRALKTIAYDTMYYKTESVLTGTYAPSKPHVYSPNTPLAKIIKNLTIDELWEQFDKYKASIDGVPVPFLSTPNNPGIKDVTNFSDILDCVEAAYKKAGWTVIEPTPGATS